MALLALKLLLAPSLVVAASLVVRRFGARIGGLIGGLPVVAGPILLVMTMLHGRAFGADAAAGSLLGLVSLAAFVTVYGLVCRRTPPAAALPLGWCTFLAATALQAGLHLRPIAALAVACASFALASAVLPAGAQALAPAGRPPAWDLPVRAGCAAAMVLALTAASAGLGPHVSGLLAPFPIITSVLAAFTHAQRGAADALRLLRGMLVGLFAFALFCFTVAIALRHADIALAFAAATAAAVLVQGLLVTGELVRGRRPAAATTG